MKRIAIVTAAAFVVAACASNTIPIGTQTPDSGSDAALTDSPTQFGDGGAPDGSCPSHCSSDLHSVLDCNDAVVTTCAATDGCSAQGTCTGACQSADDNHSNIGCDFFATNPPLVDPDHSCYAVAIANTWNIPVMISVDLGGSSIAVSKFAYTASGSGVSLTYTPLASALAPNEVALLFLADDGASKTCPVQAATSQVAVGGYPDGQGGLTWGSGIGKAFHVKTSAPVTAFDVYPYGGGDSALTSDTMLIPTSAWGDNYVATSALDVQPWIGIVAKQDGTQVTINPTANIVGGTGVAPATKGTPATYTLDAGQFLVFEESGDLTGSAIQASAPVGLWGGAYCPDFPNTSVWACDSMHQQIPAVKSLGSEYAAVRPGDRYPSTPEDGFWRFVGMVDGTTLTYDPPQTGAPATLDKGQALVVETGTEPFVVRSQDAAHPFFFGEYMTGAMKYGPNTDARGDPEFVDVVTPAQFRSSYVFFTDPTYPTTHVVAVRKRASDGTFKDVTLDCLGKLSGWQPIGASDYEYTRVFLMQGDFQPVASCWNGRHTASAASSFGMTIWGWGQAGTNPASQWVSYAFPAGASMVPINSVVVPVTPK